jgi:uncharacterized membrane protein
MVWLILGLIVFLGTHAVSIARDTRSRLIGRFGEGGYKTAYSVSSALGLILIVYGFWAYRSAGYIPIWDPPVWARHLSLVLVPLSFVLLAAAYVPSRIGAAAKHPMLAAVKIWALAHLLANGDLGSLFLFSAFLAWAVVDRIALKRRTGASVRARPDNWSGDAIAVVVGLGLSVAFILWLHPLLIGVAVIGT